MSHVKWFPKVYDVLSYENLTFAKAFKKLENMNLKLDKQDWVAFMSEPYWVEVKVEVELRLILRLRLRLC